MSSQAENFISSLVEMATATKQLPQVQADLAMANSTIELYAKQVQDREIKIIDLNHQIETLQAQLRAAEVSRDDAELRFLELDDRLGRFTKTFQVALEAMDVADNALTEMQRKPEPTPPQGQSAVGEPAAPSPTTYPSGPAPSAENSDTVALSTISHSHQGDVVPMHSPEPEVSKPAQDPTASFTDGAGHSPENATLMTDAGASGSVNTQEQNSTRPYVGKTYSEVAKEIGPDAYRITFEQWLAGGGSDRDWNI